MVPITDNLSYFTKDRCLFNIFFRSNHNLEKAPEINLLFILVCRSDEGILIVCHFRRPKADSSNDGGRYEGISVGA